MARALKSSGTRANAALKQLGIGIHIDSEKMLLGLVIGDGEIDWQPIDFRAAYELLAEGGHSLKTATWRPRTV